MIGIYFSGTGNSKYCVEQFLHEMDEAIRCYSIEDAQIIDKMKEHEDIVFAYPVQYSTLPKYVHDFIIQHADIWNHKSVYIIATMGLFSGDGAGVMARLLKRFDGTIRGGLHIKMPDSIADERALKKSIEQNKAIVYKAKQKIRKAARAYKANTPTQEGLHLISRCLGFFGQRLVFGYKTKNYTSKLKIDNTKCVSCMRCITCCPTYNIIKDNNQVVALDRCTMCYRCINSCPKQAITLLGKSIKQQGTVEKYI